MNNAGTVPIESTIIHVVHLPIKFVELSQI